MSSDTFKRQEADVLAWLLEQSEVVEGIDLLLDGRDDEGKPMLLNVLRPLLREDAVQAENRKRPRDELDATVKRSVGPARCVCVVLYGLHGSGKSALCYILREVLGGLVLSYDDIVAKHGKSGRQAFLDELRGALSKSLAAADRDQNERILFVDRCNTLRSQRSEILQELRRVQWRKKGGRVLLVDFSHSADSFGYAHGQISKRSSEQHLALCTQRVESRGAAHPSVHPSPKLRGMIHGAAKAAEVPSAEELVAFDGRVSADIVQSPLESSLRVVEELRGLRWLEKLRTAQELRPRIELTWQAYQRAESQWRAGEAVSAAERQNEWLAQCRRALEAEKAKERARAVGGTGQQEAQVPLYYKIDLPEVSKVLTQRGILPTTFTPVEDPHATLLYLGNGDDALAAQKAGISIEQFSGMREALEALQGEEFEVKMMEIVIEENVAVAVVSLPPIVPCANKVPHVTLGTKPGVPPRYANEILEEVKQGRKEGVTSIPLPTPRPFKGRISLEMGPASTPSRP